MATYFSSKAIRWLSTAELSEKLMNEAVAAGIKALQQSDKVRSFEFAAFNWPVNPDSAQIVFTTGKVNNVLYVHPNAKQAGTFWAYMSNVPQPYIGVFDAQGTRVGDCVPNEDVKPAKGVVPPSKPVQTKPKTTNNVMPFGVPLEDVIAAK